MAENRDEKLASLVDRAMEDDEFRQKAQKDLEGTLSEYGYELNDEELAAVKEFHSRVAGLSDDELKKQIAEDARQYGG